MGSNDIPPSHVPAYYLPIANGLLQVGGSLWTICYVLMAHQSLKDRTYGMPLFALSLNIAWEIVYALFVAEAPLERIVFTIWLLLDLPMIYGVLAYGGEEWNHAPFIKKHLSLIFGVAVIWCCAAQYTFAKWWLDNEIGRKEGKIYGGVVATDTTELGFWTALAAQLYLSVASLAQLFVRQHTAGISWSIWATRTLGSIIGLYLNYAWMYHHWPAAHQYFINPFAVLMLYTCFVTDLAYAYLFAQIRGTERVGSDGRKVAGDFAKKKL